jgi:hypothetical protein
MKNHACFTVLGLFVAWLLPAAFGFASFEAMPPPPINIEKDATPGFAPSIESVIIRPDFGTEDEAREQLRNWGPAAIPVLIRLHDDPAWSAFRRHTEYLISLSGAPEAVAWLKRCFEALKASDPSEHGQDLSSICHSLARANNQELAELLFDGALNATGQTQSKCVWAMAEITSDRTLSVLKQLATQVTEGKLSSGFSPRLDEVIKDLEGRLRALRPMSEILEKEGKQ